jgi:hypothetical protein
VPASYGDAVKDRRGIEVMRTFKVYFELLTQAPAAAANWCAAGLTFSSPAAAGLGQTEGAGRHRSQAHPDRVRGLPIPMVT